MVPTTVQVPCVVLSYKETSIKRGPPSHLTYATQASRGAHTTIRNLNIGGYAAKLWLIC